jgi:hypothetical protein
MELIKDTIIKGHRMQAYEITPKDKDNFEIEDIEFYNEQLAKLEVTKNIKYLIRIENIQRIFTVKGYSNELDIMSYIDYYNAKVKDVNKFSKISRIFVQVLHPK